MVASVCAGLGIRHATLKVEWGEKPQSAIQERARGERYASLSRWMEGRGLRALVTAHHLDDQAETLLMRLNRGSGARGLAGMRADSAIPGGTGRLLRPLLGWRRSELERVCEAAGLAPAQDSSNDDEQFERVRVRRGIASADWLDPAAMAQSAAHLASADAALDWAADAEWEERVNEAADGLVYRPAAPLEIRRRILARIVAKLATEGVGELRGREVDRLLSELEDGRTATLRGVRCTGGEEWRFAAAPPRKR